MPWYNDLRPAKDLEQKDYALIFPKMTDADRKRTIQNVLQLRKGLEKDIALKKGDKNLLIASWNLKEFGHLKERLPESYFYIAEIIEKFDLVAIQEVKSTLDGLHIIMRILGNNWTYLIADITNGKDGNSERFAYIYDKRRVKFTGLAGEIVLWDELTANSPVKQLKRTPYMTGFESGWKTFAMINVHLQPGKDAASTARRKEEVRLLMEAIAEKRKEDKLWSDNLIMVGDFNLYKADEDIVTLINQAGFCEAEDLKDKKTNVPKTEIYDRIFYLENKYFQINDLPNEDTGGVFTYFDYVFQMEKVLEYKSFMLKHKDNPATLDSDAAFLSYYKNFWTRLQMSDHYPVWLQMTIDNSDDFLMTKLGEFG